MVDLAHYYPILGRTLMSLTGLWRAWGFNEWVSLIGCLDAGDIRSSRSWITPPSTRQWICVSTSWPEQKAAHIQKGLVDSSFMSYWTISLPSFKLTDIRNTMSDHPWQHQETNFLRCQLSRIPQFSQTTTILIRRQFFYGRKVFASNRWSLYQRSSDSWDKWRETLRWRLLKVLALSLRLTRLWLWQFALRRLLIFWWGWKTGSSAV